MLFDPSVPMTRKKNPEAAQQDLLRNMQRFDEGCEELVELSEPIDPGNEIAVVNKYIYLEEMIKKLVDSDANLAELLDEAGAAQEVAEVRERVRQRQRWLEERHRKIGITAMTRSRDDDISLNTKSRTSLSSE